jgi:DNA-binding NarL/FixJ family response regulator
VCRQLKAEFGDRIAVVFVSGDRVEPRDRIAGLYLGGDDYVTKPFDPGELLARVRRLLPHLAEEAEPPPTLLTLTPREREVLALLAGGMPQAAIAVELMISPKTVANHIQNFLRKLGAHSRAEAVALSFRHGLAPQSAR